jgi:hypothetical protein
MKRDDTIDNIAGDVMGFVDNSRLSLSPRKPRRMTAQKL